MLLASACSFAQDVIVKKDGSTILSKVIEIGTTEVKYKKFSNQNGPNYSILKTEIQAINYEDGEKETFTDIVPQSEQQQQFNYNDYAGQMAQGIYTNNAMQKEKLLTSAKSWEKAGGWVMGLSFAAGAITGLILQGDVEENFFENTTYLVCCGIGLGVGLGGMLICNSIASNKKHIASTIIASQIIHKEFSLDNTHFSAGIDLVNEKVSKEHALGLGLSINF